MNFPIFLATDCLPPGYITIRALPTWKMEWQEALNRQFAHLSYERERSWDHLRWVPTLEKEFREAKQIAHCRRKPGFADIQL
jgi:hypothetical protein